MNTKYFHKEVSTIAGTKYYTFLIPNIRSRKKYTKYRINKLYKKHARQKVRLSVRNASSVVRHNAR